MLPPERGIYNSHYTSSPGTAGPSPPDRGRLKEEESLS